MRVRCWQDIRCQLFDAVCDDECIDTHTLTRTTPSLPHILTPLPQCNTLRKALEAHRKRITPEVEPLHNHMEQTYTKMRGIIFPHEAPTESPMKVRGGM